ncbi:MAG TPA: hypothetical protein VOB72_13480 [Candidatus Dormibacteraeota bacterium]|nr:hypothetical protein [Candidatus Dormibacteraeota bacterium]
MTSILRRPARPLAAIALLAAGALLALGFSAARGVTARASGQDVAHFDLVVNPKFASCLAQIPGDAAQAPRADVTVRRGDLNDTLTLRVHNIKPNLAFDLFTVQRSSLLANGTPDPAFKSFGLAWYQSDLQADENGSGEARVRTILLDQIFGFDPDVSLAPTNTFHVGFWFNDPADAQACGFDPAQPTPFNGEHRAGPLAMISLPSAATGLGPLCLKPDTSVTPARCNP